MQHISGIYGKLTQFRAYRRITTLVQRTVQDLDGGAKVISRR